MTLIRWSVENSARVFAFFAVVLVAAALALWQLVPLRLTPAIGSPQLAVITASMGMPALLVERHLTNPLERALTQVPHLVSIRSSSMEGMSVITLEFPYGHPLDAAAQQAQAAIASVDLGLDDLESGHGAQAPRVVPYDPLRIPVLRLAVRAPDWDPGVLANFIETELTLRLKRVPGVESVGTFGLPTQQVSVLVDRDAAAASGLSLTQIREAIDRANIGQSAGALYDGLTSLTPIQLDAQARTPSDLEKLVVADPPDGPPVTLQEIATVDWHLSLQRSIYRLNGVEAVEVSLLEGPEASSPRTVAAARAAIDELVRANPGLVIEEAYDNAHFVSLVAAGVWTELGLAVLLTGLVCYLFLGDWRATLVVLATVPATLACVVLFFPVLGLSFNSSTLIGLLLAIGRLVDDTIVDLCAVARHRAAGKDSRSAAIEGCSEVRRAVVAATAVICLGMLPLTFCGGLTQDMFEGIIWPFLLALAASLLVALTLSPCLIARLYAHCPPTRPGRPNLSQQGLDALEGGYRKALAWALRYRASVLCCLLATLYLAALMVPRLGWEMMPLSDTGQVYATLEAQPGTPTSETARLAQQLETILRRQPEVLKVSTSVGPQKEATSILTGYGTSGPHTANFWITLSDKSDRQRSLWQIVDAVYLEASLTIPHLRQLSLKEMGSDVMANAMAPVQLVLRGPDLERLAWLAQQTLEVGRRSEKLVGAGGLTQLSTTWSLAEGGWSLKPRLDLLAGLGVTPQALAQQVSLALAGAETRTRLVDGTPVMLSYPATQRRSPADLQAVRIQGTQGQAPLGRLAELEAEVRPSMIEHDNLQRSNSVVASYRPGGPGSMQLGMDWLMASRMQVGLPPGYTIEQRGDMLAMMDSTRRLVIGMGVAVVLVYLALAAQFRSWSLPLAILAAIPVSLPGVFGALLLAQQTISTVSLLGLAVLIGMDLTAAILLLDAVLRERARGRSLSRALLVGAPARLRPVLMTVMVTLAVMTPLALFPGTGMDAYAPLATVILGGLTVSTVLTLFVVPLLYSLFAKKA